MKKTILLSIIIMLSGIIVQAQTTAIDFSKKDRAGNNHNLFADLDAGNAVLIHFYMPSCGSCPPPAQKIQAMANNIMKSFPGKIKGYAIPYNNTTPCSYSSTWVSSNGLSLYTAMDSGASQVAYYGGFGMPTVVLLGGTDHKVLFSTLSFSTSDTTIMRDKILALFGATGINNVNPSFSNVKLYPNPATDQIQLELNLEKPANLKVEIVNIVGEVVANVYDHMAVGGIFKTEVNTAAFSKGVYMMRVNCDGLARSYKFTVTY